MMIHTERFQSPCKAKSCCRCNKKQGRMPIAMCLLHSFFSMVREIHIKKNNINTYNSMQKCLTNMYIEDLGWSLFVSYLCQSETEAVKECWHMPGFLAISLAIYISIRGRGRSVREADGGLGEGYCRLGICRDRRDRRSCKSFVSCVNFSKKQRSFLLILQVYTHLNVYFLQNC